MIKINLKSPTHCRQQNSALHTGNAVTNNMRFALRWMADLPNNMKYSILTLIIFVQMTGSTLADAHFFIEPASNNVYQTSCPSSGITYSTCSGNTIDINVFYNTGTFNGIFSLVAINNATLAQTIFNYTFITGSGTYNVQNDNIPPFHNSCNYFKTFSIPLSAGNYTFQVMRNDDPSSMSFNDYNFTLNVVNSISVVAEPQIYCNSDNVCFRLSSPVVGAEGYTGWVNFGDGTGNIPWSVEDGNSPFCGCFNHTFNYSGPYPHTFNIYGLSVNACGFTNFTTTYTVQAAPTISSATVCAGSTNPVTLNATPSNLLSSNYTWQRQTQTGVWVIAQNGGNTLNVSGPFNNTQTYRCTFIDNDNGCSGTATGTISIAQNPYSGITGSNTQCAGNTQPYSLAGYSANLSSNETWAINPPSAGNISNPTVSGGSRTITWTNIPPTGATITTNYTFGNNCPGTRTLTVMPCCNMPSSNVIESFYNRTIGTTIPPSTPPTSTLTYTGTSAANIITIDGVLNINRNVTFDNVDVRIGNNARINVANNCTFTIRNNSVLRARCDKMWDGIYVQTQNTTLIIENSIVQDAVNAVVSNQGGVFRIRGNVTFDKNYKHLVVNSLTNITKTAQHQGYVRENTVFTCSGPLLDPNYGLQTYTAIEINDVDNINIGDATFSGKNTIEFCSFGIYNTRGSMVIKNNEFRNITRYGQGHVSLGGIAICARGYTSPSHDGLRNVIIGGSLGSESNYIHDVDGGIDIKTNINANIISNIINNSKTASIKVYDNNAVAGNGHIINNNTFATNDINLISIPSTYIDLNNNNNVPKQIIDNSFNALVPRGTLTGIIYLGTAISVNESSNTPTSNYGTCTIKGNNINAVRYGIVCNMVSNLEISTQNTIYLNSMDYVSGVNNEGAGIKLTSCKKMQVINNTVIAANHGNWWVNGILVANCIDNKVQCNAIGHTGYGLRFDGHNYTSPLYNATNAYQKNKIQNNRMHDNAVGFCLVDGSVGDLKDVIGGVEVGADNFWTGTYDGQSSFHTYVYSNFNTSNWPLEYRTINNRMFVRHPQGTIYNPSTLNWLGSYGGTNYNGTNSSSGYTFFNYIDNYTLMSVDDGVNITNCTNNDLNFNDDLTTSVNFSALQSFANNYGLSIAEAVQWWQKYNTYMELKKDPSLADTQEKQDYVTALDAEAIGKLEEIKRRMLDTTLIDSTNLVDSKQLNEAIIPNNEMEAKIKEANNYYLNLLLNNGKEEFSFSESDEANMRELAQLCPGVYGPGVYSIRSILARLDTVPTEYISECEFTPNPTSEANNSNERRAQSSAQTRADDVPDFTELETEALATPPSLGLEALVFPNPAQNMLYVQSKTDVLFSYELLDARGSIVLKGNNFVNAKPFAISTENLSKGLYVLKLIDTNKATYISKVSIQK